MSPPRANGTEDTRYVTHEEFHDVTDTWLEAIGALTAEVSKSNRANQLRDHKIDELITDLRKVRASEKNMRARFESLPDLVAEAVEDEADNTAVTNLKTELRTLKKAASWRNNIVAGVLILVLGALILKFVFKIG